MVSTPDRRKVNRATAPDRRKVNRATAPDRLLASKVLPAPLYRALTHVFHQGVSGCMLIGGTALAGYYAGHRRSDDLDLFTRDEPSFRAAVGAVKSLETLGVTLEVHQSTAQFHSSTCELAGHAFTVQVVWDPPLFSVGASRRAEDGVLVADLPTLFRTKAGTLVSRCSEKDLYDLLWFFRREPGTTVGELVAMGAEIDRGMSAEAVLLSLVGTPLRMAACDFSLTQGAEEVFEEITALKERLTEVMARLAEGAPVPLIGELIDRLRPQE